MLSGTGWYDQSLSECVLEELDFDVQEPKGFWCVDGGAQKIAADMAKKVEKQAQLFMGSQVMKIDANCEERKKDPTKYVPMTLTITATDPDTGSKSTKKEDYFTIFNSTTLGALQRMDLKDAGLL